MLNPDSLTVNKIVMMPSFMEATLQWETPLSTNEYTSRKFEIVICDGGKNNRCSIRKQRRYEFREN